MAVFNKYPYSSFQELNLDWILQELKDLTDEWEQFAGQYTGITAEAQTVPYSDGASVTVTGGDGQPFNFDFNIPAGKDLKLTSYVITYGVSASTSTIPTVWTSTIPAVAPGEYLWTRINLLFSDGQQVQYYSVARQGSGAGGVASVNGVMPDAQGNVTLPMPSASNNNPLMNGLNPLPGMDNEYSRSDHVHPSDSSKLDIMLGEVGKKKVYAVEDASTEVLMETTYTPTAGDIPVYSPAGTLRTDDPSTAYDAVNRQYLHNNFVSNSTAADFITDTDIATLATNGICRPDGTTLDINALGQMYLKKGIDVNLLWTNTSPNNSFAAQTINLLNGASINDYMLALVIFKHYTSIDQRIPVVCLADNSPYEVFRPDFRNSYRRFNFSADGTQLTFDHCESYTIYNDSNSLVANHTNSYLIPMFVFGIR